MSLRPPSTSPSPSPGPHENGKVSARQSMGPSSRGTPSLAPASPRPGGQGNVRPTSELLGSAGMFQTPEAEALDQWFENLQNYEQTLEDMAAASLDVNFKEELGAIEQWFKVLSEAERTAALYSLLQHSTQVQIRFFITVLQQMARSDPMTALLSPAMGSMQSQMESRLAGMKSPGFKSNLPSSPTARNFTTNNRQSLTLDNSTNYLSPESAATQGAAGGQNDSAAATLAQQRAKLKASNASHRISAPVLSSPAADGRASWGASTTLSQVSEQASPGQDVPVSASRPKSTDFSGAIGTPKNTSTATTATNEATAPPANEWASMVTTPLIPMFKKQEPRPEPVAAKPTNSDWQHNPGPGVPRMGDPTIHRKNKNQHNNHNNSNDSGAMYDDNGNPIQGGGGGGGGPGAGRGGMRNASGGGGGQWKSQALNNNQSNRFGNDGSSDVGSNAMNGLGMQMGGGPGGGAPGFGMGPLGSPTMGMPGLGVGMGNMGMQPMSPFNMNMLGMMSPEAQILAAQMAASGFGQPNWMGMQPMSAGIGPGGMLSAGLGSAGLGGMGGPGGNRKGPQSARSTGGGLRSASSVGSHQAPKGEEDVDPALLNDIPAWLRSLRLHKYTPNFEGAKWQDMVLMDEAALEAKGVAALGARRKMLKTFELVRKKMGIEGGPSTPVPGSATPGGNGNGTAPNSAAPAGAGGA